MKIELDLTAAQITAMRAEIDALPLKWAPTLITKVLTALPIVADELAASAAASGDSLPQHSHTSAARADSARILEFTRAHQAQMQRQIEDTRREFEGFDKHVFEWIYQGRELKS
jgi:hypothetical protein